MIEVVVVIEIEAEVIEAEVIEAEVIEAVLGMGT